jgi:hypothetical protein
MTGLTHTGLTDIEFNGLSGGFNRTLELRELLMAENPINRFLVQPRLPEAMSTFVVTAATPLAFRRKMEVVPGYARGEMPRPDRWLRGRGRDQRLEVKGTGPARFISVTATDRLCDYLAWAVFDEPGVARVYLFARDAVCGWRSRTKLLNVAHQSIASIECDTRTLESSRVS